MILDKEEIDKLQEENKYHEVAKNGRPKNITKDKMNIDPNTKIGRKNQTDYEIFDTDKRHVSKSMREYKGQHLNKLIRYGIMHNDINYLFSSKPQICKEFNLTINVVSRLISAYNKKNNNKQLTFSDERIIEAYPKFQKIEVVPVDKTKKIIGVIRSDKDSNIQSLSNLRLTIEHPKV